MAHAVNVAENVEWLEVYAQEGDFDQPQRDPHVVESWLKNKVRDELKQILEEVLELERDEQVQARRYERSAFDRCDYRNGYRERELSTTMGTVQLRVPRGRKPLSFSVFESYQRRWQELDLLLLEAHIGGMSCRQVGERIAGLLGRKWSGSTIAALTERLVDKLESFRQQQLEDEYVGIVLDGMYVGIRQCLERKRPVVAVIGVRADGSCDLLALRVCYSENSTEVEGLLRTVKDRGVTGARLQVVTIDGDKGLEAAVYAVYGNVRIQDCIFHRINRLHRNAQGKKRARTMMKEASVAFAETSPRQQRKALKAFCEKWREKEPKAIACFAHDLCRCFEVQCLPAPARTRCTTSGLCEGLFRQIRTRIRSIGHFETPSAVELYVFAIVAQKKWIGIPGRAQAAPLLDAFTHSS
jgi:putative transposase